MYERFRLNRNRLLMALACGLAMLAFEGRSARAESISITIVANGTTIAVDPLILSGATSQNYGTVDLTTLNSQLTAAGSAYQFSALGGDSNWAGAPTGATLNLHGGIFIPVGATGSTSLTITETEDGFISPVGPNGTLGSSSVGLFNSAGPGNSHDANSSFNALTTPTYTVASKSIGTDPESGASSMAVGTVLAPYTLNNFISFSLVLPSGTSTSALSPSDGFSVGANLMATSVIPEPASALMMSIGLPLPLLGLTWLRRRRKAEASAV